MTFICSCVYSSGLDSDRIIYIDSKVTGQVSATATMAIYRLIANGTFGPAEIKAMTVAYEAALIDLGLMDRDDPITEIVATAIVTITSMGERDSTTIKDRALNTIGARRFRANAA